MPRPIVLAAAALALGILAAEALPLSLGLLVPAAALLAAISLLLACLRAPARWILLFALIALGAAADAYAVARSTRCRGRGLPALLSHRPRPVRVRGFMDGFPEERGSPTRDAGFTVFPFRVTHVFHHGRWAPLDGRLRVSVRERPAGLSYGDLAEVTLRAQLPPPPRNPGQFNYAAYLRRKGVSGLASAHGFSAFRRTGGRSGLPGMRHVAALKRLKLRTLDRLLPERPAAILKCLILGERHALTPDQEKAFRETGTIHFLAISGLHVGILAAFCWIVLMVLGVRHRLAAVLVLAVVFLYAVIAGFRPSVQRATIMCAVVCGAFIVGRRPKFPTAIALALILVLLHDPAALLGPGLQLSFVAVLGICLFATPIERALFGLPDHLDFLQSPEERSWAGHPLRRIVQKAFAIGLAAWLVTVPLLLRHFSTVHPLAPLASLILLPPVCLAVICGLPGTLLATLIGHLAQPLLFPAACGARMMDWAAARLAQVPFTPVFLPPPPWSWVLLCYAVLILLAWRRPLRLTVRRIALLAFLPLFAYLAFVWHRPPPAHLQVHMVAVGEGNCVLLRFADGRNLLFDAGGRSASDVGARIIAPALWATGVRRLHLVVISHSDADHYNGLLELARRIPVRRVAVSPQFERRPGVAQFARALRARGIELLHLGAGDRITGLPGAAADVLWPPSDFPLHRKLSDNDLSIVLRVRTPEGTVLLTGDLVGRAVAMLLKKNPDLRADLLQVPHHGRNGLGAPALACAVRPTLALVPGGGFAANPSPYAPYARRLLTTRECGMISVDFIPGQPPRLTTFLKKEQHK